MGKSRGHLGAGRCDQRLTPAVQFVTTVIGADCADSSGTLYLDAINRKDNRRLKELELYCDGVAILTLLRAGQNPGALLTGAKKIANFNRINTGPAANLERYPTADERKRFAEAVVSWAGSHPDQIASTKGN
jgi:hypothetical protein